MTLSRTLFTIALASTAGSVFAFDVTAKSAVIIDAGTGKILWQKGADTLRYPASTTKVMTGLLLVENCKPDEIIVAPKDIESIGEASMHLRPGERVRAKDLLYGMMLRSANDGSYAAAVHMAGSMPAFARMMNARARELGCTHTHFNNPNGLHDPLHYTTAHDLALISRAAMKNPWFRDVVKTQKVKINRDKNWQDLWMVNHDKMLRKDPTADGIKTGYTVPAGACFVGSATRQGWRVITVLLKSKDWKQDNQDMMNWAFHNYEKANEVPALTPVGEARVVGGASDRVAVVSPEPIYVVAPKGKNPEVTQQIVQDSPVNAPVVKGQPVATLVTTYPDGFVQRTPVVAQNDVAATSYVGAVNRKGSSATWIAGGLLLGAAFLRRRSRRTGPYGKAFF